ncbi:MAG: hypothetical protein HY208_04490, partial [Nitrospirae bacterium]|nr:hypothetical protein [Nitrospirota bacterium]
CGIGPLRRYAGNNPAVYDSVQCVSCHNPHSVTYPKFLRAPIVDCSKPANPCVNSGLSANSVGQQLICFFCHNKDSNTLVSGNSYSTSTHAISKATHTTYPSATDHPSNPGYDFNGTINIGQASCRNCHDPHTAQGAIRLHREGVDTPGGGDAIENTCYLCHSPSTTGPGVIQPAPFGQPTLPAGANTGFASNGQRIAPDIYSEFAKDHNLGVNTPCDRPPELGGGNVPPQKPIASAQTDCGSAMRLQLDDGLGTVRAHQPFFIKLPQEGVEFNDPAPPVPGNENPAGPGISQPDDLVHRHIECVDCHNPHQVTKPTVAGSAGRMKGMKGITYNDKVVGIEADETGCLPAPCKREPYVYEVCFRCHGNAVPTLFNGDDNPGGTIFRSNPQPGAQASVPDLSYQGFSNKRLEFAKYGIGASEVSTDTSSPTASYEGNAPYANTQRPTWSPLITDSNPDGVTTRYVGPGKHKSFHPVVGPGRNGSVQLFNQLKEAFGLTSVLELTSLTIQCTDCHNNNYFDRFTNPGVFGASTTGNLPIAPEGRLLSGPLTESSLRVTSDRSPNFAIDYNNPVNGRVAQPIGPHGSSYIRLLRARYNTDIANPNRDFRTDGFGGLNQNVGTHFNNFLLCFQCHDRRAFDPYWTGASALYDPANPMTNFFGRPALVGPGLDSLLIKSDDPSTPNEPGNTPWDLNLHMYHLVRTGAYCHECHYNVHSNAQARNTIYGDGTDCVIGAGTPPCNETGAGRFAGLPPDGEDGLNDQISDTHLLNFSPPGPNVHTGHKSVSAGGCVTGGPTFANHDVGTNTQCSDEFAGVEGVTAPYAVWYYDKSNTSINPQTDVFRCNLRCHGVVMATCFYRPDGLGPGADVSPGNFWCAGGDDQRPRSPGFGDQ